MSELREEFSRWLFQDKKAMNSLIDSILNRGRAEIDVKRLIRFNEIFYNALMGDAREVYEEIVAFFLDNDNSTVNSALKSKFGEVSRKDLEGLITFVNVPQEFQLTIGDAFLPENNNRLAVIEGMIEWTTIPMTTKTAMVYTCLECGHQQSFLNEGVGFSIPKRVACEECRSRKTAQTETEISTLQVVKIVEAVKTLTTTTRLSVFIWNNMVDTTVSIKKKIIPGKNFKTVGIIRQEPKKTKKGVDNVAVFVQCLGWDVAGEVSIEVTPEDKKQIQELAEREDCIDKLVSSFCPTIYGYQKIKEAMLLQLVSGVGKTEGKVWKRGDIHLLLVGDPSVGKSVFSDFLVNWFPRTVYTVVGQSTSVGLGLALEKDPELGIWVIKAGALVLASNGLAVMDEFHTVKRNQIEDLKSAMEQQVVTTTKAGICSNMKIRTPVLALMNPVNDSWDKKLTKIEQVKLPEVLLSRFDVKFAMEDKIERERDEKIIDTMFGTREQDPPLSDITLLKYLLAARKIVPTFQEEVFEKIKNYALDLREKSADGPMKIRFRQIDSLRRLSEAEAKLRLSDKVEMKDFERAKKILEDSLREFGYEPETGEYDVDAAEGRLSHAKKNQMEMFMTVLMDKKEVFGERIPYDDLIKGLKEEYGWGKLKSETILEKLKETGRLYEPKPGFIGVT